MSRFLYNIFLYLSSIFAIFFLIILYINDWKISFNKFNDSGFNKKVKVFNESIKHNKDINLILGSSLVNSFLLEGISSFPFRHIAQILNSCLDYFT